MLLLACSAEPGVFWKWQLAHLLPAAPPQPLERSLGGHKSPNWPRVEVGSGSGPRLLVSCSGLGAPGAPTMPAHGAVPPAQPAQEEEEEESIVLFYPPAALGASSPGGESIPRTSKSETNETNEPAQTQSPGQTPSAGCPAVPAPLKAQRLL